ncbi:protein lin-52 homolog isoform X2 [Atheta coriaria]|uniref:protein lin-52 homolog isoform X2 n=1 Tax=Dalotia coriaria TaxID=877792 RepID=UPI0031F3AA3C
MRCERHLPVQILTKMASESPEMEASNASKSSPEGSGDEMDTTLISMENIDRESPQLWPEKSMNEFMNAYSATSSNKLPYSREFDSEDTNLLNQLSAIPVASLIAKVKELHDLAYQLGIEEAKEMTRGKCLQIFDNPRKNA